MFHYNFCNKHKELRRTLAISLHTLAQPAFRCVYITKAGHPRKQRKPYAPPLSWIGGRTCLLGCVYLYLGIFRTV